MKQGINQERDDVSVATTISYHSRKKTPAVDTAKSTLTAIVKHPAAQIVAVSALGLATSNADLTLRQILGTTAVSALEVGLGHLASKVVMSAYNNFSKESVKAFGNQAWNFAYNHCPSQEKAIDCASTVFNSVFNYKPN